MIDKLRKIYNKIDTIFDRSALESEINRSYRLRAENKPVTAKTAFRLALLEAKRLDKHAALKMIVAPDGVDPTGKAIRWEFFFDLIQQRAKLICEWFLSWDAEADSFGPPQLVVKANPFPPADSPLHQLVSEGKLLHRQLNGFWQQERRRQPDLPHQFRDSDEALAALIRQGLSFDQEVTLSTTEHSSENESYWVAKSRYDTFLVNFT